MKQSEIIKKLNQSKELINECLIHLSQDVNSSKKIKKSFSTQLQDKHNINFSLNHRAFFKEYSSKKMNGQKKFTLVVAYLTGGKLEMAIDKKDVENQWNKVSKFMNGKYENMYSTRAKEDKYLNSPKFGIYNLTENWKKIFN